MTFNDLWCNSVICSLGANVTVSEAIETADVVLATYKARVDADAFTIDDPEDEPGTEEPTLEIYDDEENPDNVDVEDDDFVEDYEEPDLDDDGEEFDDDDFADEEEDDFDDDLDDVTEEEDDDEEDEDA